MENKSEGAGMAALLKPENQVGAFIVRRSATHFKRQFLKPLVVFVLLASKAGMPAPRSRKALYQTSRFQSNFILLHLKSLSREPFG